MPQHCLHRNTLSPMKSPQLVLFPEPRQYWLRCRAHVEIGVKQWVIWLPSACGKGVIRLLC